MKRKKVLSTLLSAALMIGVLSAGAFAADLPETADPEETYVLMNIPYGEFYAAQLRCNEVPVDTVSSATLNKTRTNTSKMAAGSYHVNKDGSDITGVTYPVKVEDLSLLVGLTEVTDSTSVTVSVTNRGTTSEETYTGREALFESPSYAYYKLNLSEEEDQNLIGTLGYKTLTASADGSFSFGEITGAQPTVLTDASVTITQETSNGDYMIDVEEDAISSDTIQAVYGVVLSTAEGTDYGLRHVENIWMVHELAFCTGFTTDIHGSPTSSEHYLSLVGQTINQITYYTDQGVYEIPLEDGLLVEPKTVIIDGVDHTGITAAKLYDETGEINLSDTELFPDGAEGAYLLTVGSTTELVGNTTLDRWVGTWENWQNWIDPDEEMLARYPDLEQAWDEAYDAYIAAFDALGMGDTIRSLYPDVSALKAYWYEMTDTQGVDRIIVSQNEDGGYVVTWLDKDGETLASDTYTMTGKVLNGLEGAVMYVFTADTLEEDSTFRYWVTMAPDMEGDETAPIAAHYHFQFGSDLEALLTDGQWNNSLEKGISDTSWYATMINADASDLAKYNVILGLHTAEKWSALPEDAENLPDDTGEDPAQSTAGDALPDGTGSAVSPQTGESISPWMSSAAVCFLLLAAVCTGLARKRRKN